MPALDFASDNPKVLTYHSAKGLTFDSVLLPRLVRSSFASVKEPRMERMLFVAISRATRWVYLSTSTYEAFKPIELLVPLKAERALEIHGGLAQGDLFGR
jgi:superfamily I DNA/RNA helicase